MLEMKAFNFNSRSNRNKILLGKLVEYPGRPVYGRRFLCK